MLVAQGWVGSITPGVVWELSDTPNKDALAGGGAGAGDVGD